LEEINVERGARVTVRGNRVPANHQRRQQRLFATEPDEIADVHAAAVWSFLPLKQGGARSASTLRYQQIGQFGVKPEQQNHSRLAIACKDRSDVAWPCSSKPKANLATPSDAD
jgi:hypothetical protein